MTAVLVAVAALAVCLALSPARAPARRVRAALSGAPARIPPGTAGTPQGRRTLRFLPGRRRRTAATVPLTVVVQQLAALLKGGRTPSRLWDELWTLYAGEPSAEPHAGPGPDATLAPGSLSVLAAARSAALRGAPVGESIRRAGAGAGPRGRGVPARREGDASRHDSRVWAELAACFDIAEASGCPLADLLTRFAAQLDAEDDAEAARQTALAGPRATVRLLTWLPVLGMGLGMLLGADPLEAFLGTPFGVAALAAGIALTVAGRTWSAGLVRSAAGLPR